MIPYLSRGPLKIISRHRISRYQFSFMEITQRHCHHFFNCILTPGRIQSRHCSTLTITVCKKTRQIKTLLPSIALVCGFVIEPATALDNEIIIDSQPVSMTKQSIKCDVDEIENISTRRLVHCDSAKLVELRYKDISKSAVKFTIAPFDDEISKGVRAELRDMYEAKNGEVVWYRFSTLLEKDFPMASTHRLVLAQWHERTQDGVGSLRPPLSHRLWNGQFVITLWNQDRIDAQGPTGDGEVLFEQSDFELGVFHEFVYKLRWSASEDGEITGWTRKCPVLETTCPGENWQQIVKHKGSTGYDNEKVKSYYFKLGLYTVTEFDVPFTAYHRDYRIGANAEDIGIADTDLGQP